MAIIGADGLSLLVGDGGGTEVFTALKGAVVTRLEINQRSNVATAVSSDAWLVHAGTSGRRAMIECDGFATDEAPALRLRSLMLSGAAGNFRLELNAAETLVMSAVVTLYREIIEAGGIKKLQCRLESSGAVTLFP